MQIGGGEAGWGGDTSKIWPLGAVRKWDSLKSFQNQKAQQKSVVEKKNPSVTVEVEEESGAAGGGVVVEGVVEEESDGWEEMILYGDIYIYIYIKRERERERERVVFHICVRACVLKFLFLNQRT